MASRLAGLLLLVAGCSGFGLGVERRSITIGTPECLDGGRIRVRFAGCLSSSCDTLVSATCTVSVKDGLAEVTGRAEVESEGDVCTDDCGFMLATCDGSLETATRVRFSGNLAQLGELPSCDALP